MVSEAIATEYSVAAQIHAVAQAAYALEADIIGCRDFPPLREPLEELRQSSDRFLVFQRAGRVLGALSIDRCTDLVTITRLVVLPMHLRQGIASALLAVLEQRFAPAMRLSVTTAQANTPAITLYQRLGYTIVGASGSPEGIPLVHLNKCRASDDHGELKVSPPRRP